MDQTYKKKSPFTKRTSIRIFFLLCLSLIVGSLYQNCAPEDSYPEDIPDCTNGGLNPPTCDRFAPCTYTHTIAIGKETISIENGKTRDLTDGCTKKTLSCKDSVITTTEENICNCVDPVTKEGLPENKTIQHLSTESGKTNCIFSYTCKNSKLETSPQTCPDNNNPVCVFRWTPQIIPIGTTPIGKIEVSSESVTAKYSCTKSGTTAASSTTTAAGDITLASRAGSFTLAAATSANQPINCTVQLTVPATAAQATPLTGSCTTAETDRLMIKPTCIINSFPTNAPTTGLVYNSKPAIDLTITDPSAIVAKINFDCGGSNQGTVGDKVTYRGPINFQPTVKTTCSFSINTTYDTQPIACTDAAGTTKASWEVNVAPSTDSTTTCNWKWDSTTVKAGESATGKVEVVTADNSVKAFYSCHSLNSTWLPITLVDKKGSFTRTNIISPPPDCTVIVKDSKGGARACDQQPPSPLAVTGTAPCPKYYKLAGGKADADKVCVADYDNYECKNTKDIKVYPGYSDTTAEINPLPTEAQYVRNAYCLILNRDPGNPASQPFLSSETDLHQPAGGDLSGLHYYTEFMLPVTAPQIPGLSLEGLIKNFLDNPKFVATLTATDSDEVIAGRLASALLFKTPGDSLASDILAAVTAASDNCSPVSALSTLLTEPNLKKKYCKFLYAAQSVTKDNTFKYYTDTGSQPKWNYSTVPDSFTDILGTTLQIAEPAKRGTLRDMNASVRNLYKNIFIRDIDLPLTANGYKTGVIGQSMAKLTKYYSNRTKPIDIYDVIISLYLSRESLDKMGAAPKTNLKAVTIGTDKLTEAQIHLLVTDLYNRFFGRDPMTTTETGNNESGCLDNDSATACGQTYWEDEFKKASTPAEQLQQWPGLILNFLKSSKQNEKPEIQMTHPGLFPETYPST